jgi:hypothetical protein
MMARRLDLPMLDRQEYSSARDYQRNMRRTVRRIFIAITAAAIVVRPGDLRPKTAQANAPALELKKVISFPIGGKDLPQTRDALAVAITNGLRDRMQLPTNAEPVHMDGAGYPALDKLSIDLTDAAISSDHKLPKLKPRGEIEQGVKAQQFEFKADPMKVDGADIHLNITATDVDLGLQRDPLGKPILVLSEAKDGKVTCDTTMKDLSQIFRASADFRGKSYGLRVQQANLKLASGNEHQLLADLRLKSTLTLIPIALHFTAQADVDDAGNAHLSKLSCDGDDIAGWLISGFIRPALNKQQRTVQLIQFPTDQIKLHDVGVKLDGDAVHITAGFGS